MTPLPCLHLLISTTQDLPQISSLAGSLPQHIQQNFNSLKMISFPNNCDLNCSILITYIYMMLYN